MICLAIDTSTEYLSLALDVNGKRFTSLEIVGNKQSHYLINSINNLIQQSAILPSDIDLIAYIEGPGSFTGLRIGLSVALGLAYGINAHLVAIPAFTLYAKAIAYHGDVLVGLDARLGQVYLAGINTETLDYFIQPQLIDPENIFVKSPMPLLGSGFKEYHTRLNPQLQTNKFIEQSYPGAENILEIVKLNKYPQVPPHAANLAYLRNKVALNLKEQQLQKNQ